MARLKDILESWRGTPYFSGSQAKGKGGGVDCVRFGAAVLDELYGFARELPRNLALDTAVHDAEAATVQLRALLRLYPELESVPGHEVQPGDMVVVGPANGGPGHLMVVGCRPNTLWEAIRPAVDEVGCTLDPENRSLKHIYRAANRGAWML